jgi:hypothetical protein
MGDLKQKIQNDLTQAVKEGEELTRSTLRVLLASILSREKEKRYKISKENKDLIEEELAKKSILTDEEVIEVISFEVKKRKEAILEFEKGKREDLANKEKAEVEILQKYLPEQLAEEEIRKIVKEAIEKTGAKEIKDMGRVMAEIMPQIKGKADGSLVSKIVKELLSTPE